MIFVTKKIISLSLSPSLPPYHDWHILSILKDLVGKLASTAAKWQKMHSSHQHGMREYQGPVQMPNVRKKNLQFDPNGQWSSHQLLSQEVAQPPQCNLRMMPNGELSSYHSQPNLVSHPFPAPVTPLLCRFYLSKRVTCMVLLCQLCVAAFSVQQHKNFTKSSIVQAPFQPKVSASTNKTKIGQWTSNAEDRRILKLHLPDELYYKCVFSWEK